MTAPPDELWPTAQFMESASWRIVAEIVRHHPELMIIERHPGGGAYDCLSVFPTPPGADGELDGGSMGDPVLCLETTGWAVRPDGTELDLVAAYRAEGRRVWPIVHQLIGDRLR